jgi:hypothetical protein
MRLRVGTLIMSKVFKGLFLCCLILINLRGANIYLSADSTQKGLGTIESPYGSIKDAQAAVRSLRLNSPNEQITVWLLPGIYRLQDSVVFNESDSGTPTAPVTWKSLKPGSALISGAMPVDKMLLKEITDKDIKARLNPSAKDHVKELDLNVIGLKALKRFPDRFSAITGFLNVFYGDELMHLSRWPNIDQGYASIDRVLDSGSFRANENHGATFVYKSNHPDHWEKSLDEEGIWLRGFWRVPWIIEGLRVKSIDTLNHQITFNTSTAGGVGSKYSRVINGTRVGGIGEKWCAINLVEEIDQPGEWAVSFKRNKLYFWPPRSGDSPNMLIAAKVFPLVVFNHASFINFEGISLKQTLGDGIRILDGQLISIIGCFVKDVDICGINIKGGKRHRVLSCEISNTGQYGIDLTGGDRATLSPAMHEINNNHIHNIGLAGPFPAIRAGESTMAEVVGNHIFNNRIHDCPNAGVRYAGNDNIIEYNEVYRVGLDSSDLGAFYTNSGWTSRGNILRYNLVHHSHNAQGFYLDDGDCGDTITHNIVIGVSSGAFVGGGSDISIDNNIFIECDRAIHIDARGRSRDYTLNNRRLTNDLNSVPYTSSIWVDKYPRLSDIKSRDTRIPSEVYIDGNYAINCKLGIRKSAPVNDLREVHFGKLYEASYVFSKNFYKFNFNSKNIGESRIINSAFQNIPWDKIGLHLDEFMTTLPERNWQILDNGSDAGPMFDSQIDINASNHI